MEREREGGRERGREKDSDRHVVSEPHEIGLAQVLVVAATCLRRLLRNGLRALGHGNRPQIKTNAMQALSFYRIFSLCTRPAASQRKTCVYYVPNASAQALKVHHLEATHMLGQILLVI